MKRRITWLLIDLLAMSLFVTLVYFCLPDMSTFNILQVLCLVVIAYQVGGIVSTLDRINYRNYLEKEYRNHRAAE